jgi:hypothetical protein
MQLEALKGLKLTARSCFCVSFVSRREVVKVQHDTVLTGWLDAAINPVKSLVSRSLQFKVHIASKSP